MNQFKESHLYDVKELVYFGQNQNNIIMDLPDNQMNEKMMLRCFMQIFYSENKSIISDIFYGFIHSLNECLYFGFISQNYEAYFLLIFFLKKIGNIN